MSKCGPVHVDSGCQLKASSLCVPIKCAPQHATPHFMVGSPSVPETGPSSDGICLTCSPLPWLGKLLRFTGNSRILKFCSLKRENKYYSHCLDFRFCKLKGKASRERKIEKLTLNTLPWSRAGLFFQPLRESLHKGLF